VNSYPSIHGPMNSKDRPALTVESLLAMRSEPDAVRVITERLGVKDMGPADHIRTKHEVKAFVQSAGDPKEAKAIIRRAQLRQIIQPTQSIAMDMKEGRQRRIGQ
jgi:hypothetical protein